MQSAGTVAEATPGFAQRYQLNEVVPAGLAPDHVAEPAVNTVPSIGSDWLVGVEIVGNADGFGSMPTGFDCPKVVVLVPPSLVAVTNAVR